MARCPVVDDPKPAAFARPRRGPADLAKAARPSHDGPLFRAQHQRELKLAIPFVVEMAPNRGREDVRLDEPHR